MYQLSLSNIGSRRDHEKIDRFSSIRMENSNNRKPLLLHGARQVGKTHAVRQLGKTFDQFIEINLEQNESVKIIIEKDLDVNRIILQLGELLQVDIAADKTLLFIDEIQNAPKALLSLRYFFELMPTLHVIAAGSLLDFAIEEVGIPVRRVSTLYMYPLSFLEFLVALGYAQWTKTILQNNFLDMISDPLHEKLLNLVGMYLAIGGMPAAINAWRNASNSREVKVVHSELIFAYEQDFGKYAKKQQIKYLHLIFLKAIEQLSNKFMYARVGEYQKRELAPALELIERAGILYKVINSSGQGIPLGAQAHLDDFKIVFLDVGLSQALLNLDINSWFIDPLTTFINKGELVEAFVGQELLAYSDPIKKETLFYWHKETRGSSAEVDYLVQLHEMVMPIEVKAGKSKRIKSMKIFLESHPHSPVGIRYWSNKKKLLDMLNSYPLYAVITPLLTTHYKLRDAALSLLTD